ncbi:MAG: EcsC family protein [Nitrospinae bacterium]|nr:EcsC family protein [Nitrospinota bacterium]
MNAYEQAQSDAVERWKRGEPETDPFRGARAFVGYALRPLKVVTEPLAKAVTAVIPDGPMMGALAGANRFGKWLADEEDLLRRAGAESVEELGDRGMKASDRLAEGVRVWGVGRAGAEGFATGSAGFLLIGVDAVALVSLSFRTIHKTGLCYGYRLEGEEGERFALSVLAAATAVGSKERANALSLARQVEADILGGALGTAVDNAARRYVGGRGLFFASKGALQYFGINLGRGRLLRLAPLVGAVVGGVSNVVHLNRVAIAARRMFQERWLEERRRTGQ